MECAFCHPCRMATSLNLLPSPKRLKMPSAQMDFEIGKMQHEFIESMNCPMLTKRLL